MHGSLLESASPVQSIRKHDSLNPEKRPARPLKSQENPEIVVDGRLKGAFSRLQRPWRVVQRACSSGSGSITRPQCQTTMDDDLANVQRYRAGIRSSYGRRLAWWLAALSLLLSGALSGGRGSGKREAGEDRGGLIELEGYQVKLLGEQLRKDGALRPRDPGGQVRFPPLRVSDQAADVMLQWGSTRCGQGRGH